MASSTLHPSWLTGLASSSGYQAMFTSRGGDGNQKSPYADFNICHYTGDDPAHVAASRQMLISELGLDAGSLIVPRQTHSANVRVIDSLPVDPAAIEGVDALVTRLPEVAVGVSTADCVPVVIVDERNGVAGVAHAGWRGALGGVVDNTVGAMLELGADVSRMDVFFGPSICCDCFEVGEEVAARFPEEYVVCRAEWPRPHIDLPAYVAGRLLAAGIPAERIRNFSPDLCTRCHPGRYFSARITGVESGRNFTFVMLKRKI
ncbi:MULTISPECIES: polyphenol oxidase family protein [Duncaniella]|uniref:polyphenol oxidase family protein n=2 Tax=Muribaculaceae TaxID=2005473 RepID=UPI0010A4634D|nr:MULTISPECIES: polyphenol oxidase family protein [Duncaniella]QCD39648.1 laccase domain-containing protein [Duncaniella sp. C9]QCP73340.1 laccase domain-containing protein [Duncaniella sp. B8]GFI52000.1 polyphenol oxidase [Muribaculaceae bacterium]